MLNKDILGLIRGDVKRNKKPKKQLEDFLIGDDEVFEESLRKPKKTLNEEIIDDLDAPIGEAHGEDKKSKPTLKVMNFGELNKKQAKEQIRDLKREYLTLFENLEETTEALAEEQSEKYEVQIKLEYIKKEQRELKRILRETLDYFPDAFELKVELDSTDWKVATIEKTYFEKLNNLKTNIKNNSSKIEEEQFKSEEQKKILIKEIEDTREHVVKVEREKFDLKNEIKSLKVEIDKLKELYTKEKLKEKVSVPNEPHSIEREVDGNETQVVEEVELFEFTPKDEGTNKIKEKTDDEGDEGDFDFNIDDIDVPNIDEILDEVEVEILQNEKMQEELRADKSQKEKKTVEVKNPKEPIAINYEERKKEKAKPEYEKTKDEPKFEMPKFKDISTFENLEVKKEEAPNYLFISVDKYLEGLNNYGKTIIKIIGDTGVERNSELLKLIDQTQEAKDIFYQNDKLMKNEFNNAIKNLRDRQFLESVSLKLGSKGGYDFIVYKLTDIGQAVYYKLFDKNPVKSEMDKVVDNHASLEHGYLIKETAIAFKEMGYEVLEEREDCTYNVGNGNRKVFDLIVIDESGKKMHIEVERGTHNQQDFSNMMDKIFAVTDDIYFVAPNEKILYNNVKGKVFSWITNKLGGFENAKGKVKFNFATFEKIKKKQTKIWEKYEP